MRQAHEQALRHLGDRGFIQFHPALADRFGHKAALFLGLALYWTRHTIQNQPGRNGWFYMAARQWQASVGLSGREQSTARALLTREGLLQESLTGRPAVLHFRVDLRKLSQALGYDASTAHPERDGDPLLFRNWVCFYKPLADLTGNVACGLYLSYLLQMQRRALLRQHVRIDAIQVSQDDVSIALHLGSKVQRNARERLRQAGLMKEAGPSLVLLNLPAIVACLQAQNGRALPRGRRYPNAPTLAVVQASYTASRAASDGQSRSTDGAEIASMHGSGAQLPLGLLSLANATPVTPVRPNAGAGIHVALSDLRELVGAGALISARSDQVARTTQVPGTTCDRTAAAQPSQTAHARAAESAKLGAAEIAENAKLELPKTQRHISISLANTTTTRDWPADSSGESDGPRRRLSPNPVSAPVAHVAIRQPPPNTVDQGNTALVYPQGLDPTFLPGVLSVLAQALAAQRQPLLDELDGQLRIQGKTIHNPAGWLMGLIRLQRADTNVVLAMAGKVAEEREYRLHVQRQIAQATQGKAMPATTPEPAQNADPTVRQEALRKLTALRAAIVAKRGQ